MVHNSQAHSSEMEQLRIVAEKETAARKVADQAAAAAEQQLAKFKSKTVAVASRIEAETKSMAARVRTAEEQQAAATNCAHEANEALAVAKMQLKSLQAELVEVQTTGLQQLEQQQEQAQREQQRAAAATAQADALAAQVAHLEELHREKVAGYEEDLASRTTADAELQNRNSDLQSRLDKQLARAAAVGKELREAKGRIKTAQQELTRLQSVEVEVLNLQQVLQEQQEEQLRLESSAAVTLAEREAKIARLEQQLKEESSQRVASDADDDNLHKSAESTAVASQSVCANDQVTVQEHEVDTETGMVSAAEMASILKKLQALHEDTLLSVSRAI